MKEEKDKTKLYQKLQSTLYKYGSYKKGNLGEGMIQPLAKFRKLKDSCELKDMKMEAINKSRQK